MSPIKFSITTSVNSLTLFTYGKCNMYPVAEKERQRERSLYLFIHHPDQDTGHFHHLEVFSVPIPVNMHAPAVAPTLAFITMDKFYLPCTSRVLNRAVYILGRQNICKISMCTWCDGSLTVYNYPDHSFPPVGYRLRDSRPCTSDFQPQVCARKTCKTVFISHVAFRAHGDYGYLCDS